MIVGWLVRDDYTVPVSDPVHRPVSDPAEIERVLEVLWACQPVVLAAMVKVEVAVDDQLYVSFVNTATVQLVDYRHRVVG